MPGRDKWAVVRAAEFLPGGKMKPKSQLCDYEQLALSLVHVTDGADLCTMAFITV